MISVGLDPSLRSFGWAAYDGNSKVPQLKLLDSGTINTNVKMVPVMRFIIIRNAIDEILKRIKPDVVGIESPAYGGGNYSENHFALMIYSMESVFNNRIDCVLFDPTTVKYLAGNAKADKKYMQNYVKEDTSMLEIIGNDEADAYCIAKFASQFYLFANESISVDELTKQQKHVFLERKRTRKTLIGKKTIRTAHLFKENKRYYRFSKVDKDEIMLPKATDVSKFLEI